MKNGVKTLKNVRCQFAVTLKSQYLGDRSRVPLPVIHQELHKKTMKNWLSQNWVIFRLVNNWFKGLFVTIIYWQWLFKVSFQLGPESFVSGEGYDGFKNDMWAFGLTLLVFLNEGKPPFWGQTEKETIE